MHDGSTGRSPAAEDDDQEYVKHVGKAVRAGVLGLGLMMAPAALVWAGLLTGPGWAWPLWACQTLGLAVFLAAAFRAFMGPLLKRHGAVRKTPRVPCSPEVRAHQRRMDDGPDTV